MGTRLRTIYSIVIVTTLMALAPLGARAEPAAIQAHAIAMHGTPKYGPDFTNFDYVNPNAPKGGEVVLAAMGGFDSFNPYIVRGESADGLGLLYDTLLVSSLDEPFTKYGLVAESIEMPEDRSWVRFHLRPEARFNDGTQITAEDVVFSFNLLREQGSPTYRSYWADVTEVVAESDASVLFRFRSNENRELPLVVGELPILPHHYWRERDFTKTSLEPPLGSGPYRIATFEPGRSITYERVKDYWGWDLPVKRGTNNFDRIRYEYYRDTVAMFEAFKAGEYDYRLENISKVWNTQYTFPAVRDGRVIRKDFEHNRPAGMQAFVMNTRRELFADRRVRRAFSYMFNFEWTNRTLFFNNYKRSLSYFANSEMAARDLPRGESLALLNRYRDQLPPELFTTPYDLPRFERPEDTRRNLRQAIALLADAGWELRDGRLVNADTGAPFRFEMLLVQPTFERIVLPFKRSLARLGIDMRVRVIDVAQYINRIQDYDFDMVIFSWGQSNSPGNEQRIYWGSDMADRRGGRNFAGIKDPVVDALIEQVIVAPDRDSLVARVRALDRVLLWGHYVIPQWYIDVDRIAYWDIFGQPEITPAQGVSIATWWIDADKARALGKGGF